MNVRLRLEVPAGPRAPAAARNALAGLVDYVEPQVFEDVQLLVSELVTNSFRHGTGGSPEPIEVTVTLDRHVVRVEVADRGGGFDPHEATRRSQRSRGSGWGLFLVDRLAARWGVARGEGTRVWLEIDGARRARVTQRSR